MTVPSWRRPNQRSLTGILLALLLLLAVVESAAAQGSIAVVVCAAFAMAAFTLRGVTLSGSFAGFVVALALWLEGDRFFFCALLIVFVLTWLATRIGRARKQQMRIAEQRRGRDALQVLANVGLAAALVVLSHRSASPRLFSSNPRLFSYAMVAALAILGEAAADTVASEIGKAYGGAPRLITTWNFVEAGASGGMTMVGSVAGICAAIIVSATAFLWSPSTLIFLIAALGAILGMFFDSLLGATLEGRYVNNDSVNFLSTCFAAASAAGLLWLMSHLH